jgi:hypothetical protein
MKILIELPTATLAIENIVNFTNENNISLSLKNLIINQTING